MTSDLQKKIGPAPLRTGRNLTLAPAPPQSPSSTFQQHVIGFQLDTSCIPSIGILIIAVGAGVIHVFFQVGYTQPKNINFNGPSKKMDSFA